MRRFSSAGTLIASRWRRLDRSTRLLHSAPSSISEIALTVVGAIGQQKATQRGYIAFKLPEVAIRTTGGGNQLRRSSHPPKETGGASMQVLNRPNCAGRIQTA